MSSLKTEPPLVANEFDCYGHLETEESGTVHLYIQATIGETHKPIEMKNIKDLNYEKDRKHHLVFAIPEANFESFKPHAVEKSMSAKSNSDSLSVVTPRKTYTCQIGKDPTKTNIQTTAFRKSKSRNCFFFKEFLNIRIAEPLRRSQ
jgi:hypothetical protein